jgi:hypothetical protein
MQRPGTQKLTASPKQICEGEVWLMGLQHQLLLLVRNMFPFAHLELKMASEAAEVSNAKGWLSSHRTLPFPVAIQPPHCALACGYPATPLYLTLWLSSHHTTCMAIQPSETHFFSCLQW